MARAGQRGRAAARAAHAESPSLLLERLKRERERERVCVCVHSICKSVEEGDREVRVKLELLQNKRCYTIVVSPRTLV